MCVYAWCVCVCTVCVCVYAWCVYVCTHTRAHSHAHEHFAYVEAKGQLCRIVSRLCFCGFWGLSSGFQALTAYAFLLSHFAGPDFF